MNQQNHDVEGQTLARIYRLLLEKSEKQNAQKKVLVEGTTNTIQGDNSSALKRNHHEQL